MTSLAADGTNPRVNHYAAVQSSACPLLGGRLHFDA